LYIQISHDKHLKKLLTHKYGAWQESSNGIYIEQKKVTSTQSWTKMCKYKAQVSKWKTNTHSNKRKHSFVSVCSITNNCISI